MSNENLKPNQKFVGANCIRLHFEDITKNHKGITLIALIITIIVMMILVAVSVTVALDGGLFGTAKDAASKTQIEAEKEMLLSAVVGAIGTDAKVDLEKIQLPDGFVEIKKGTYKSSKGNVFTVSENGEIINGTNGIIQVPNEELTEELKTAINEGKVNKVVKEIKDGKELQAVIPAGFDVSTKNGENTISGGLVIFDEDGNEFVWVPCTTDENNTSGLVKYAKDTQYNDGTTATKENSYKNYSGWTDESINVDSVSKYGGFYVGRYEAGIPSDAPFYTNADGTTYIRADEIRNTTSYIPVSKPNNPIWNQISQANAKIVSEAMYSSSESVESSLIDSYAWDTIVNWMESKNPGIAMDSTNYGNFLNSSLSITNGLYAVYRYDYTSKGWYSWPSKYTKGTIEIPAREQSGVVPLYELATGSTDDTKVLNVYDMAGNMWEWTTESREYNEETVYIVYRGGRFWNDGSQFPISSRLGNCTTSTTEFDIGFRVVLYIK